MGEGCRNSDNDRLAVRRRKARVEGVGVPVAEESAPPGPGHSFMTSWMHHQNESTRRDQA
jgi:hypothetical protein